MSGGMHGKNCGDFLTLFLSRLLGRRGEGCCEERPEIEVGILDGEEEGSGWKDCARWK